VCRDHDGSHLVVAPHLAHDVGKLGEEGHSHGVALGRAVEEDGGDVPVTLDGENGRLWVRLGGVGHAGHSTVAG
jgi:hypothetical protein